MHLGMSFNLCYSFQFCELNPASVFDFCELLVAATVFDFSELFNFFGLQFCFFQK